MGVREKLNQRPAIVIGVAAIAIVAAVYFIYSQSSTGGPPGTTGRDFYTDDDGKTWFVDTDKKVPPFDHNGKTACRAKVLMCADGKIKFVGWLERCLPAAKTKIEGVRAKGGQIDEKMLEQFQYDNSEVKRPGEPETAWVRTSNTGKYMQVINAKCPDGKSEDLGQPTP